MRDLDGKKVVIVGAARQGTALARFMVRQGAHVVINDQKSEAELDAVKQSFQDVSEIGHPIRWIYNGHPLNLLDECDVLCISGGVPTTLPLIKEAYARSIPVTNDSQIFLEISPCPVIGITGSAGKTTTTLLVGHILHKATKSPTSIYSGKQVWIGGNIGNPLIENLEDMGEGDIAVMELSSFQLEIMNTSPHVAVVLNIAPDHLDRHQSMDEYIAAKTRILQFQSSSDIAVLGRDDENIWSLSGLTAAQVISFGLSDLHESMQGTFIRDGMVCIRHPEGGTSSSPCDGSIEGKHISEQELFKVEDIPLRGEHNLRNILAAAAITYAVGVTVQVIQAGVKGFTGGRHRLEFIRTWNGVDWFNDSIATTPRRAMAAINSFDEPLVLLAGGRDKNLPWEELIELISQKIKVLILFGELVEKQITGLDSLEVAGLEVIKCAKLHEAVKTAADIVKPGDVVLLSPGGTSFDEFSNYEERGEYFAKWVEELP